jgi:hypothetical protein
MEVRPHTLFYIVVFLDPYLKKNPDPDPVFSAPASASGSDQPEKSQIWPFQDLYPEISFMTGTGIGTVLFFIDLQILQNFT